MPKKQLICGLSTLLLYAGFVAPARADFTPIAAPNAAYQAITNKLPVGVEGDSDVSSISDVTQTASFFISGVSAPLHIYDTATAFGSWATWSSPPLSESATPEVLGTTSQLDIQLTNASLVFGFEAEPQFFVTTVITADFFGGGALHQFRGEIQQSVTGDGGAKLFAGFSSGGIDDIQISSTDSSFSHPDFGIAQLRYGNISPVPEPKYVLLLAGVGVLLVLVRSRQISGSRP
jgi:hypothetical protein